MSKALELSQLANDITYTEGSDTLSFGQANIQIGSNALLSFNEFSGDLTVNSSGVATLSTVNSNIGSFGSGSAIPVVTVNAKGLVTAVSTQNVTIVTTTDIAGDSGTDTITLGTDTLTVAGGTGLTSAVTNNNISIALDNTAVTAASYGSATAIPVIAIDAQGRITSASTSAISTDLIADTTPQLGGTLDANGNTIDMGTNVLTDTNLGQFITAHGWGDHSSLYLPIGGGTLSGSLTVTGNFTVNGTQTIINTTTLNVSDNIITLNNDEAGTPSQNAGIEVERGTSTNVSIRWNETTDKWQYTNDGSSYSDIGSSPTGDISFSGSTIASSGATVTIGDNLVVSGTLNTHTIPGGTGTFALTSDIDLTTSANYAYRQITDGSNQAVAGSNIDTFTVTAGADITATVTPASDTLTIANTSTLNSVVGRGATTASDILFQDNVKARFGDVSSPDMEIYHDTTNSIIKTSNTHSFKIMNGSEDYVVATPNNAVTLYHNGLPKIATASSGVTVTGTVAATAYTGDGSALTGLDGAAGGGTDHAFLETDNTINSSYSISSSRNAMTIGPVTVASGATITVPSGQRWVIM